ncbi:MAG: hypothetical protein K2M34_00610 [Alphaproteobacteria bacterium]|nr:hypothetical protein [Alphaproteobacteria bacterium]
MKTPIVFSLVHEQSVFMTAIMSLLTFLSVLALGVALSIGTGVIRWNTQWNQIATIQVMNADNTATVKNILDSNRDKIESVTEVSTDQMKDLLSPWISGSRSLENYLPKMFEVKFKTKSDMIDVGSRIDKHARFLTHAQALRASTAAGWKMIFIAGLVLALTIGAIGVCITYIARNTALLHRRELEILNQIGASDAFVAHQMQIIVAKICTIAGLGGFIAAVPVLLLILSAAHSARVGLLAMLGLGTMGWIALILMPILIVVFAIFITRRTTLNLLKNS